MDKLKILGLTYIENLLISPMGNIILSILLGATIPITMINLNKNIDTDNIIIKIAFLIILTILSFLCLKTINLITRLCLLGIAVMYIIGPINPIIYTLEILAIIIASYLKDDMITVKKLDTLTSKGVELVNLYLDNYKNEEIKEIFLREVNGHKCKKSIRDKIDFFIKIIAILNIIISEDEMKKANKVGLKILIFLYKVGPIKSLFTPLSLYGIENLKNYI